MVRGGVFPTPVGCFWIIRDNNGCIPPRLWHAAAMLNLYQSKLLDALMRLYPQSVGHGSRHLVLPLPNQLQAANRLNGLAQLLQSR
jgi:hypothetical protein